MKFRAFLVGLLLAVPLAAQASTFNIFRPATGVLVGDENSPTTTAATAATIIALWTSCSANEFLSQAGTCDLVNLASSVTGTLPVANGGTGVTSLGNLTRVDDTNVTLTLGGTPTGAVINSTSLTLGWAGQLSAARGGTGLSTVTDDTMLIANGTTWQSKALTDCDGANQAVTYDTTANTWGCATISGATFADPSGTIGLTATNGVATTAMRSDATPALSQSIAPTWTGTHTFSHGTTAFSNTGALLLIGGTSSATDPYIQADVGDNLYLGTGGAFKLAVGASDIQATVPVRASDGAVGSPAFSFASDTNLGLYRDSADDMRLVTNGTTRLGINNSSLVPTVPLLSADGSASAPTYSFGNDPNTGIYRPSADNLTVAAGGVAIGTFYSGGLALSTGVVRPPDGTAGAPTFTFDNDTNTGMYRIGADTLGFATAGALQFEVQNGGTVVRNGALYIQNGSTSTPATTFINDQNTGIYSVGADSLGIATGGTNRVTVGPGVQVGAPTGGDQGAGTVNATGLYINGVPVSGGSTVTGTFSSTLTGYAAGPTCSMKYRLTGSRVDLWLDSGSACQATSNATTLTLPSLPSAIQPSASTYQSALCNDGGALAQCATFIDSATPSVLVFRKAIANTGTGVITFGDNFTASGNKGLPAGWGVTYDLRN